MLDASCKTQVTGTLAGFVSEWLSGTNLERICCNL